MTDWDNFIEGLAGDEIEGARTPKPAERFPCGQCAGTGLWQGGRENRHGNNKCIACQGRGYFTTPPRERQRARARAVERKDQARQTAQAQNEVHDDGALARWVSENSGWNSFAASLLEQSAAGRAWSENQIGALRRMMAKVATSRKAAADGRQKARVAVDLAPIADMFNAAMQSGYKRPTYRAEGLVLSLAAASSRNAGAIYVKGADKDDFGEAPYLGKGIDGTFMPARGTPAAIGEALQAIASDPRGAAVRYGQKTGRCSCCGRELTDGASIEAGIGPVCATKWNL